jgi:hypothetical protein
MTQDAGPSYRQVVDLADLEGHSVFVAPPGKRVSVLACDRVCVCAPPTHHHKHTHTHTHIHTHTHTHIVLHLLVAPAWQSTRHSTDTRPPPPPPPAGQSGNEFEDLYDNELLMWADGKYLPMHVGVEGLQGVQSCTIDP